ncbi:tetratricopeptide repeat protein [Streptomyces sp. NPDC051018]|uniref:tetratricopeptide repeat protein n=1 Tax=Streptomyces sp. NPDC051018 TaxID=3365639 RepID=UPI0037A181CC
MHEELLTIGRFARLCRLGVQWLDSSRLRTGHRLYAPSAGRGAGDLGRTPPKVNASRRGCPIRAEVRGGNGVTRTALGGSGIVCEAGGMITTPEWERRSADLWAAIDDYGAAEFRAKVGELADELPEGHAVASFERASAHDSTGEGEAAVPLYRKALEAGLTGERRRRAVIQMSSTLRALGHPETAVELLTAERDRATDHLDDAVAAFLALALIDVGREREAASMALGALSKHLPRYNRSLANYARMAIGEEPSP